MRGGVAPARRLDALAQRVPIQARDRLKRRFALDGEHYLEVLRIALRDRGAGRITMQFLAYDLWRLAFLGTDSPTDHLPPGIVGDGLLIGERPPLQPGYLWLGILGLS